MLSDLCVHEHLFVNIVRLRSFVFVCLLAYAGHLVHERLLFMNVRLCSFARLEKTNRDHCNFSQRVRPGVPALTPAKGVTN